MRPSPLERILAPSSPVCPFCKGAVSADTLRFGGNCPHCMLEIPGEEAPTDPGLQAKQRQEEEQKVKQAARTKKNRLVGVVALVALLGVGAGAWKAWENHQASMTYEMDDYYVMPLEDIAAPPPGTPEVVAAVETPGSKPGTNGRKPVTNSASLAMNTRPSEEGSALKQASGGDVAGDAMAPGVSTALPGAGELGTAAIKIGRGNGDEVLTDDAEIFDMMKRVITALSPQVTNCYSQRLKQYGDLKGAWKLSFTVAKDGSTKGVSAKGVNGSDAELESCIVRTVQAWKFQKIYTDKNINKTYRFGPSEW